MQLRETVALGDGLGNYDPTVGILLGNMIAMWVNLTREILGLSPRCYHVADFVILPSILKRPTQDKLNRLLSKKHSLCSTNV